MTQKTYIYEYSDLSDLTDIEKTALAKANELNDRLLDLKIMIDDVNYGWAEFIDFLEGEKISKVCEFRGGECIDFDEELLNAIVATLKRSLDDTKNSINHNSKKIALSRVLDG